MFVMNDRPCLYVDIDFTLIAPYQKGSETLYLSGFEVNSVPALPGDFYALRDNIETVRTFHARGHSIVFWSAGGANWARMVVEALNLQYLACAVMNKPNWYLDDKPARSFMDGPDQRILPEPATYRRE